VRVCAGLWIIEPMEKEALPDRGLFDTAYQSVAANPDDILAVRSLEFVFAVFSAKLQAWLTYRRLEYARSGRDDLANPKP